MRQIIKDNIVYFSGFLLFIALATGLLLSTKNGDIILYFSQNRSPEGDLFFKYFTKVGEEWSYISCFLFFLLRRVREGLMIVALVIGVFILSFSLKAFFQQDRPHTFFSKQIKQKSEVYQLKSLNDLNFIQGVEIHTGQTSFPSGHTLSAFALFGLVALLLKRKRSMALVCLTVAILVGVSRIYLVQHFLKDVYLGAIVGTLFALLLYYFQKKLPYRPDRWYDQALFQKISKRTAPRQV